MKIGIIGLGYWGKILLRNLRELGYTDITVCEQVDVDWSQVGQKHRLIKDYKKMNCDTVFVVVPAKNHYNICRHLLSSGVNVFCEKPLDMEPKRCQKLYNIARKNNAKLFVDWLFTYNPAVNKIKTLIGKWGNPKNIITNRLNFGPARKDVSARWDLASHDVSIACYLLEQEPASVSWIDFKRDNTSKQEDSTVGILKFPETTVQINASWAYGMKNRMCIFEFDNGFLYWDDTTSTLLYGSDILEVENVSPLHCSIKTFINDFDEESQCQQEELTMMITNTLQGV